MFANNLPGASGPALFNYIPNVRRSRHFPAFKMKLIKVNFKANPFISADDGFSRFKTCDVFDSVASTSASASASASTSNPRVLERDVLMEALRCEQERFRKIVETGRLEKEKLLKETEMVQVQLELAKTELALKQHLCQVKGINLDL